MKYLYIGLALLGLTLGAGFLAKYAVSKGADEIAVVLEAAVDACDGQDYSHAYRQAEEAARLWEKHEPLFCALLDHAETDDVHWCFARIRSCIASDSTEDFRAGCAEALTMVRHLKEMEQLYLFNLL